MHGILRPTKNSNDAYSTPFHFNSAGASQTQSQSQSRPQEHQQPHAWGHWNAESYYQSRTATDAMANPPYSPQYSFGSAASSHATPGQTQQQSPVTSQTSYNTSTPSYSQPSTQYATPTQGSASSSSDVYEGYAPAASTYAYPGSAPASMPTHMSQSQSQSRTEDGTPSQTSSTGRSRGATVYGLKYASQAMDLDAMIAALRADIEASAESPIPECTTTELSLHGSAFVPLLRPTIGPYADGGSQDLPEEFKVNFPDSNQDKDKNAQLDSQENNNADGSSSQPPPPPKPSLLRLDPLRDSPQASVDSTLTITDSKARAIVQRAASRGLVQHIENLDGFRYSFNNAWSAKDEDGLRFSYICQDSMQNKDRHANGFARTQKNSNNRRGGSDAPVRGPRKATYDCKGTVSVKFSAKLRAVVIQYRHYAIHGTVADRKPPPRGVPSGIRGMKRKRHSDGPLPPPGRMPPPPRPPSEPSLFELLQQSAYENAQKEGQLGDAGSPWWGST